MRTRDTDIGGGRGRFPTTRRSAVLGAMSADAEERARSFEALVVAYWKPVYKHARLKWNKSNEDAKDLTQGFFLRMMEKEFLGAYDPNKGRFRTFLRTCLDRYLSNEHVSARRLKRGGGHLIRSLEFEQAEGELATMEIPSPERADRCFEEEWVRSLLGLTVAALKEECAARGKGVHFRLFERYDLDDSRADGLTYEALAGEFGISATDVTNHLAFARREFRRILLEKLREITATEEEFRLEARYLLGITPS